MSGLTPCRQLRPSSRQEHVKALHCLYIAQTVKNSQSFKTTQTFISVGIDISICMIRYICWFERIYVCYVGDPYTED